MQKRVQSFTSSYNGISRVLKNEVQISIPFDPLTIATLITPEGCGAKSFFAIWDTGATGTVVNQKVLQECGLKPIGVARVSTANGERLSSVYLISLFLPNKVLFPQLRVTEGTIAGADVLIGMDIITKGDFAVTNSEGRTTFSYRWPSVERIDFVKGHGLSNGVETRKSPVKVGRNDPCPCGSGRKYKRCCGSGI